MMYPKRGVLKYLYLNIRNKVTNNLVESNYVEFKDKKINLKNYALKEFGLKIEKEWYFNNYLKRLNWICNSQKHNDGIPQINHPYYKDNLSNIYLHPENEKITISSEKLKDDIEFMIQFIIMIFQNVMQIALFRMMEETEYNFVNDSSEFQNEQNSRISTAKLAIQNIVDLLKTF